MNMTLKEAASLSGGSAKGPANTAISRITIDSRQVRSGDTYLAVRGERVDGHEFIPEALRRGAANVIVSKPVKNLPAEVGCLKVEDTLIALQEISAGHRRRFQLKAVGITGSNGKTTTKEMTAQALARLGKTVLATRGNLNSQIGLPLMLLEIDGSHTHAVLEMGASQKGNIARLAELAEPSIGIITSIGAAHLETFKSMGGVLSAKWELAASLLPGGTAVLNADDPLLMSKRNTLKCRVFTFGLSPEADIRAENVQLGEKTVFEAVHGKRRAKVRIPSPGLFNVRNALAAASVCLLENETLSSAAEALSSFNPPAQRMEVVRRRDGAVFLVDAYNANPTSMKASLESFVGAFPGRRRFAVLGGMLELGRAAKKEHEGLGELLKGLPLEKIFFLGEEGAHVQTGFGEGLPESRLELFRERLPLERRLKELLGPDVAVLFKASRGIRLEEIWEPLLKG